MFKNWVENIVTPGNVYFHYPYNHPFFTRGLRIIIKHIVVIGQYGRTREYFQVPIKGCNIYAVA